MKKWMSLKTMLKMVAIVIVLTFGCLGTKATAQSAELISSVRGDGAKASEVRKVYFTKSWTLA
jgi:hypothetical protein